jgi:hypothetical protein
MVKPDDRRRSENLRRRADVVVVVLDDFCLLAEDKAERSSYVADVERLVIVVEQKYDAVH